MLNNIKIVLIETSHPGNIGATARAMKTMGLSQLVLVNPIFFPDSKAVAMASRADDILDNAVVVDSLDKALVGCSLVIGSSSDIREIQIPLITPREIPTLVAETGHDAPVAIVFGTERSGMTSDDLLRCNYHMKIPTSEEYSSLNLAQAVQIVCYELAMYTKGQQTIDWVNKDRFATFDEVNYFYKHLEQMLLAIKFLNPRYPKKIMPRLQRLFNRVRLEHMELQLLRGILTKVEEAIDEEHIS